MESDKVKQGIIEVELTNEKPVETHTQYMQVIKGEELQVEATDNEFDSQRRFAKKITAVVENCKLYTKIMDKKYVHVEGWEALGAMTNHTAVIRCVKEDKDYFEAVADLYDGSNRVVSSGIARAYKEETLRQGGKRRWEQDYQVLSMAQTRAIGKAYRNKLAWIIRLAGYAPTPAEEMTE
jgi:hypothetical protein